MDDILLKTTKERFPFLSSLDFDYKYSPGRAPGFLEFWPADEPGTEQYKRPDEFPLGRIGVEVFDPNTRPIDIAGDVVSHHLVKTDPYIKQYYDQFQASMTSEQKRTLERQYSHAVRNDGEERSFEDWAATSGIPAYFRGYAFQQWDRPEQLYTPAQMKMFDKMMNYLQGK